MIGFMPFIYPDELVYSWFCRYYMYSGFPVNKMGLEDLLYNRHCNPSKEFIGHLNPEMEQAIKRMYPMEKMILEHTMFPQYARFIGSEQKKNSILHLEHDFCDAHHLFAILPRTEADQWLKYCPLCAGEDKERYSETYWHRRHQIRNMNVCTRHKCRLKSSRVPAKSEQCFTLNPAETALQDMQAEPIKNHLELEFATYMEKVFDAHMDMENDIPVSAILYFGMEGTKYLSATGRVRNTQQLASDIQDYFDKIGLVDTASYYQIQRTLLGDRFDFSIVCQIAFFLGISIDSLVRPVLTGEQLIKERNARCPKKEDCPKDWDKYDREMVPIVEQAARDIYYGNTNATGRPERISERLINKYAGVSAHRLENMPRCQKVLCQYKESYARHWARRMVWAYEKLRHEKGDAFVYWCDIRRLTGIKKKNFSVISTCLEEFTDKVTADAIRRLVE